MKGLQIPMLDNGNLSKFRIVASGVIGLVAVGGGIYLLHANIAVPREYWIVTIAAISGVVGLDLLASLVKIVKPQ
jgi:hypothetical protein